MPYKHYNQLETTTFNDTWITTISNHDTEDVYQVSLVELREAIITDKPISPSSLRKNGADRIRFSNNETFFYTPNHHDNPFSIKFSDIRLEVKEDVQYALNLLTLHFDTGLFHVAKGSLKVKNDLTLSYGGLIITWGTLVMYGKLTVTHGDIIAQLGNIGVQAGDINVLQGDINVNTGNVSVSNGNLDVAKGSIAVGEGNLDVVKGDIAVEEGNINVAKGDIVLVEGNIIEANPLSVSLYQGSGGELTNRRNSPAWVSHVVQLVNQDVIYDYQDIFVAYGSQNVVLISHSGTYTVSLQLSLAVRPTSSTSAYPDIVEISAYDFATSSVKYAFVFEDATGADPPAIATHDYHYRAIGFTADIVLNSGVMLVPRIAIHVPGHVGFSYVDFKWYQTTFQVKKTY